MFRNILITGASAGLGREFARQLAPHCRHLILVARRHDRLDQARAQLLLHHSNLDAHIYEADLADPAQREAFVEWVNGLNFKIDLLINNAGYGDHGPFAESDWDKVRGMIQLNVEALTHLTLRLLPQLKSHPRAAILNVSSIAGMIPLPDTAVYAATKAYVSSFSEALRAELRGTGVGVTQLCPGPVETEFTEVASRGRKRHLTAPEAFMVSPRQVVAEALRAVRADRPRVVPGLLVCVVMLALSALPLLLLRPMLNRAVR